MEVIKESIFISAIRSLCKTLFGVFGIFLAFIPIILIIMSLGSSHEAMDKTVFSPLPDLNGNNRVLPANTPAILQIKIHGVIGNNEVTSAVIESQLIESRKGILQNNRVKGILLYMQTPGGTVVDSDNIYRMLQTYKAKYNVPVYAFIDGLCASGGVFISCAADQIFSSPVSIIGSVGVFSGPFFNVYDPLNKWGVKSLYLSDGKNKTELSPYQPWKENEGESLQKICSYNYQNFVEVVTANRVRVDKDKLINEYGAKVFDPPTALEYGFIDHDKASYQDTLEALLQAAGIDMAKPYQVVELVPKAKWLSDLIRGQNSLSKTIRQALHMEPQDSTWRNFSYLYQP